MILAAEPQVKKVSELKEVVQKLCKRDWVGRDTAKMARK
jgi:hypothetical protein